jgi:hypothetical protein
VVEIPFLAVENTFLVVEILFLAVENTFRPTKNFFLHGGLHPCDVAGLFAGAEKRLRQMLRRYGELWTFDDGIVS